MAHSILDHKRAGFYWHSNGYELLAIEQHTPDPARGIAHIADKLSALYSQNVPPVVLERFSTGSLNLVEEYLAGKATGITPESADFRRVQHMVLSDVLGWTVLANSHLPQFRETLASIIREKRTAMVNTTTLAQS